MLNSTCVRAGMCVLETAMTKINKICRPNVLTGRWNHYMFFCFEEVGISLSARIKICIF